MGSPSYDAVKMTTGPSEVEVRVRDVSSLERGFEPVDTCRWVKRFESEVFETRCVESVPCAAKSVATRPERPSLVPVLVP